MLYYNVANMTPYMAQVYQSAISAVDYSAMTTVEVSKKMNVSRSYAYRLLETAATHGDVVRLQGVRPHVAGQPQVLYWGIDAFIMHFGDLPQNLLDVECTKTTYVHYNVSLSEWVITCHENEITIIIDQKTGNRRTYEPMTLPNFS